MEDNKDYEEEREKLIEVELAQRIVNHLLPKENVKVKHSPMFTATKTLRTKEGKSVHGAIAGKTEGGGFLPTTTHEKIYEKFYKEGVKVFSKEVEERFAEILTEFRAEVDKQKALERPEEDRQEAQARINEIYQQIKTIIQQLITEEEEEPLTIE
ncbi:12727_t:CDS:2 [Ambispora leptoticha]|uniref:12727_t:CDS:1 n=1 Tax=Ambispora leptoticha TaxID=144679 RepID=A0A9N9HT27_9GLOM|nr:12727_t:CDS:2 [Ambispora leptoticha]